MSKILRSDDDPLRVGLVLTREEGQQIMIGDDIKITVTEIRSSGKVRIGILAPQTMAIHRMELYKQVTR